LRNFLWDCFQVTGSIDAYLLYKDMETLIPEWEEQTEKEETIEEIQEPNRF
jgi:hypothetical protein